MVLAIAGEERPNAPFSANEAGTSDRRRLRHRLGHNDPSALLDKARPVAVADARRKAEIYASAGGARIGRLMVLTEEAGRQTPVAFSRALAAGAPAPTPIEDKLTVTVTARLELTQ